LASEIDRTVRRTVATAAGRLDCRRNRANLKMLLVFLLFRVRPGTILC
jgi:hypothetical protein